MSDERAVNTVVDVSLALVFLTVAIGLLASPLSQADQDHDPWEADRTTDVIGGATTSLTYSIESVADAATAGEPTESYPDVDLERVTHGSIASHVATLAVSNGSVDEGRELQPATGSGSDFHRILDAQVRTALVNASFDTRVIAQWEAFDGSSLSGRATIGPAPPPNLAVSATTMTVPSGFESVRDDAIGAVDDPEAYDVVARLVADAVIEGYLPALHTKRALESSGLERELTRWQYQRLATEIPDADPGDEALVENIRRESVDAASANEYLARQLTAQLEPKLAHSFATAHAAARAVTVGHVTIAVETWDP